MASVGHRPTSKPITFPLSARFRALSTVGVITTVGLLMSLFNMPLISSAAGGVEVLRTQEATPTDPRSPAWERAKEAQVPLSAQQMQQPGGGTTRAVRVRAIEDGHTIAIRVSWDDPSKNDTTGAVPSDAAAIQLPIDPEHLPYQCMGQSTNRVNIWQWKAVLEREGLDTGTELSAEGPGIRNLTSNGICKAVDTPGVVPRVRSYHDGRGWNVVFYRALSKGDFGTAPLVREKNSSIAFAVWNGERGEVRGMKAVSTWNSLLFETPPASPVGSFVTLGVVLAVSAGAVAWAMRRFAL